MDDDFEQDAEYDDGKCAADSCRVRLLHAIVPVVIATPDFAVGCEHVADGDEAERLGHDDCVKQIWYEASSKV